MKLPLATMTQCLTQYLTLTLLWACLWAPMAVAAAPQGDPTAMFFGLPRCVQSCTLAALTAGGCDILNVTAVAQCSCTNVSLKAGMSKCVQTSCAWPDQRKAARASYEQCKDWPRESRQNGIYTTTIACLVVPLIFVALRYYARLLIVKSLWWDDWMLLVAMVSHIGGLICVFIATDLGFGLHLWNVYPDHTTGMLKLFHAVQMVYILIQVSAKLSIVFLYWRIFPTRWFRIALRWTMAWLVGHGLAFCCFVLFQCRPVAAVWDRALKAEAQCLSLNTIAWAGGACAIFEDLVILLLPIPEVVKLHLTVQKKIAVYLMFAVGSIACLTSSIRLKYIHLFGNTFDEPWENTDILIWSIIEVSAAIVCACLPALRPLLRKVPGFFAPSGIKSNSNSNSSNSNSSSSSPAAKAHHHHHHQSPEYIIGASSGSGTSSVINLGYPPLSRQASAGRDGFEQVSEDRDELPFATRGMVVGQRADETELSVMEKGVGVAQ